MVSPRVLLIVVDEPTLRSLFNRYLRLRPHHLVYVADGEDGYERVAEVKPSLVVAHARAPSGIDLCLRIRRELGWVGLPLLLVGDAADEPRAEDLDVDGYMVLPASEASVLERIDGLLSHGRAITDLEPPARVPTEGHALMAAALDLPVEVGDVDTVVSYQNPFYEDGAAEVGEVGGQREHVTHVSIEAPALDESAATRVTDPIEEPRINTDSGPPPIARPSTASGLIAEVPRERTPTGDSGARPSSAVVGERRGLDESQLGKRLAKRVRAMHRMMAKADYYELLGVDAEAGYEAVRRAYYELSLEFHPDRFFLLRSGDLKEKIYAIYRQVGEAFRVLGDDDRRRAYDADRNTQAPPSPTNEALPPLPAEGRTDEGRRYVKLAEAAYTAGDLNHARLLLMLARTAEPDNGTLASALQQVVRATTASVQG